MSEAIKAGDVVQLKSGGPKMTVEEIKPWNEIVRVWCNWFDGTNAKADSFPLTSLKPVEESRSGPAVAIGRTGTQWS